MLRSDCRWVFSWALASEAVRFNACCGSAASDSGSGVGDAALVGASVADSGEASFGASEGLSAGAPAVATD